LFNAYYFVVVASLYRYDKAPLEYALLLSCALIANLAVNSPVNQTKLGNAQNPYVAVMSCPRCGTMGLITRRQLCGFEPMICGGDFCSAEYQLEGENICYRSPQ